MHPLLAKLEREGAVTSRLERGDPKVLGRPLRRTYSLTEAGEARVRAVLAELRVG